MSSNPTIPTLKETVAKQSKEIKLLTANLAAMVERHSDLDANYQKVRAYGISNDKKLNEEIAKLKLTLNTFIVSDAVNTAKTKGLLEFVKKLTNKFEDTRKTNTLLMQRIRDLTGKGKMDEGSLKSARTDIDKVNRMVVQLKAQVSDLQLEKGSGAVVMELTEKLEELQAKLKASEQNGKNGKASIETLKRQITKLKEDNIASLKESSTEKFDLAAQVKAMKSRIAVLDSDVSTLRKDLVRALAVVETERAINTELAEQKATQALELAVRESELSTLTEKGGLIKSSFQVSEECISVFKALKSVVSDDAVCLVKGSHAHPNSLAHSDVDFLVLKTPSTDLASLKSIDTLAYTQTGAYESFNGFLVVEGKKYPVDICLVSVGSIAQAAVEDSLLQQINSSKYPGKTVFCDPGSETLYHASGFDLKTFEVADGAVDFTALGFEEQFVKWSPSDIAYFFKADIQSSIDYSLFKKGAYTPFIKEACGLGPIASRVRAALQRNFGHPKVKEAIYILLAKDYWKSGYSDAIVQYLSDQGFIQKYSPASMGGVTKDGMAHDNGLAFWAKQLSCVAAPGLPSSLDMFSSGLPVHKVETLKYNARLLLTPPPLPPSMVFRGHHGIIGSSGGHPSTPKAATP